MGTGHVIGIGAVPTAAVAALMQGDTLAAVEQLDRAAGRADVDLRPDQAVRHRVEEPVVLDVIVDADAGEPPLGELVLIARQGRQGRALDGLEEVPAGDAEAADDMIVDAVEGTGDGGVGLGEREEGLSPQAAEDAGLGEADPVLDLGLVLGPARSGRQDADAVVRGHHPVAAVELRVVERGLVDPGLQVVGHDQARHAAEEAEHPDVRADPVRQRLGPGRLGVGEVRGAEHGDEDLRLADLAGVRIDDGDLLAGVVDEDLVAGDVILPHARRSRRSKPRNSSQKRL